jgi:hypothetical protein
MFYGVCTRKWNGRKRYMTILILSNSLVMLQEVAIRQTKTLAGWWVV